MKPRSFAILAVLTVVVVVAAAVSVIETERTYTTIAPDRERAFPDLVGKENTVTEFSIVSEEARFTVVRAGKGWGLKEKSNYRVSFEKVKAAIVSLSELKLLEAKTADPERYHRLQVEEPGTKEAKSIGVELKDGGGKMLASGVIGKRHVGLFGSGGAGTYLRQGKEARSWLAQGQVDLGATPNDWMVRDIVNIEAENVRRALIRQPDGAEIVVTKDTAESRKYAVAGVPEGRKLKDADEGKNLAGGLWRLSFEDVKPATTIVIPPVHNVAEYETFGGVKVRVDMIFVEKTVWGRFKATVDPGVSDEKARAAAQKKADEINSRSAGWIYELSPGEGEKLTTKIGDVLEKPKES
jgi:hypothetical protein